MVSAALTSRRELDGGSAVMVMLQSWLLRPSIRAYRYNSEGRLSQTSTVDLLHSADQPKVQSYIYKDGKAFAQYESGADEIRLGTIPRTELPIIVLTGDAPARR